MPTEKKIDPAESPRHLFAYELRKWRHRAGLTQEQLGEKIGYSAGMVASVETLAKPASEDFARRCDSVLGADGTLFRIWKMAKAATPTWFRPWLEVEREATTLKSWEPLNLPGLLQTEAYARQLFMGVPGLTAEQVEQGVAARMARRAILEREEPPDVWLVIDEGVLSRPVGSPAVMREQLLHLVETVRQMPRVSVQILPIAAQCMYGLSGAFAIAQIRVGIPDTVYLETAYSGQTTEDPRVVTDIHRRFEAIRSEACPQHVSIGLIKEAAERWT